ncbi:MAG: hypothetical protein HF978_00295 [Desulfobacteraceae bacterium]|nr:hypothetical protein [Desulfobacteraceae bacterium]MBC2753973.1 hypothetical protein [Desulfobacteraceae bacterium]
MHKVTKNGIGIIIDSLFSAASAVCVTGLTKVDTESALTFYLYDETFSKVAAAEYP